MNIYHAITTPVLSPARYGLSGDEERTPVTARRECHLPSYGVITIARR